MHDPETGKTIPQALIMYDVACQYFVNFQDRLRDSAILLALYAFVIGTLVWAVGKFHLGAHKAICYVSFSVNHKEGSGQVDGETMEPLWSKLNMISITGRVKSLAHRQENKDTGILDSNWKKFITLGMSMECCTPSLVSIELLYTIQQTH